jgi:hypothetical protein
MRHNDGRGRQTAFEQAWVLAPQPTSGKRDRGLEQAARRKLSLGMDFFIALQNECQIPTPIAPVVQQ